MGHLPKITKRAVTEDGVDRIQFTFSCQSEVQHNIQDFVATLDACTRSWLLSTLNTARVYSYIMEGKPVTFKHATVYVTINTVDDFYALEQALLALDNSGTFEVTDSSVVITSPERHPHSILHITAGSDDWQPTQEDLENLTYMFLEVNNNPRGGVITTIKGVDAKFLTTEDRRSK